MELVTGIEWEDNRAIATGLGPRHAPIQLEIGNLGSIGLPGDRGERRLLDTDFQDWLPAQFAEYAFAIGRPISKEQGHSAWAFHNGSSRYVVPALALMRALFRPHKTMLPRLFRPQSLEDVCTFTERGDGASVAVLPGLGNARRYRERSSVLALLSWFYFFPSARRSWSSVYAEACKGALGMSLPLASSSLVLNGVPMGNNFYVTRINVMSLCPKEEPFEFASKCTVAPIDLYATNHKSGKASKSALAHERTLGLRQGEAAVSDVEWNVVREILDSNRLRGRRSSDNTRGVLDGILQKLCFGTPWMDTTYPSGITHSAASTALHRWRGDGRWEQVFAVLSEMRRPESSISP